MSLCSPTPVPPGKDHLGAKDGTQRARAASGFGPRPGTIHGAGVGEGPATKTRNKGQGEDAGQK